MSQNNNVNESERQNINNVPDHRAIGVQQQLFFFHELSPGSCFWLPKGTIIFNRLRQLMEDEYVRRGFQEVKVPIIVKKELLEISGHWDKYQENIFKLECDDEKNVFAMMPMHCPLHCLMFKSTALSYKDLPIRYADFTALHRNELEGSLRGLLRNRLFHQDDAHIFCTKEQIKPEMKSCLEFLNHAYGIFKFDFSVELSTRPDNFIGDISVWDKAEKELEDVLNEWGKPWKKSEGAGAFYGSKIDIHLKDSLGRSHQCATIQLDFNLPERFKLEFVKEDQSFERPVMIHRAIYGSFERFIAILCEQFNGKWPFFISPNQIKIIPINSRNNKYSQEISNILRENKYCVELDDSDNTLNKKILNAQKDQYNYMIIIGDKEEKENKLNVRYRDRNDKKMVSLDEFLQELNYNTKNYF